jgi:WD40 repeat protein
MFRKKNQKTIIPLNKTEPSKGLESLIKRSKALTNSESSKTKKEVRVFSGHTGQVNCCAFGEGFLLSGGEDSNIFSWNYETGQLIRVFKGHQAAVTSIVVLPNQKGFVSSDNSGYIYYWEYKSGKSFEVYNTSLRHRYGWQIPIVELSLSPKGEIFFIGQDPLPILVWTPPPQPNQIYQLSGELLDQSPESQNYVGLCGGSAVDTSPDGKFVAAASERTIFICDLAADRVYHYFGGPPYKFFYSPTTVFTTDLDHSLSGMLRKTIDKGREDSGHRHSGLITSLRFLPGSMKIVSCSEDQTVRIWDFSDKTITDPPKIIMGHNNAVRSLAISKDGKYIFSGGDDATIRIHHAKTGNLVDILQGHDGIISHIAISVDGDHLASCGQDSTIRLWELW